MLDRVGQIREWERCAREKNQGQPDNLVEDLSLLHGIGDAGDYKTERAERNRADSN